MDVGQFRVTLQHRPDPAALEDERQPELLRFGQPQRAGQRPAASRAVAAGVAEPRVNQPALAGGPVRALRYRRLARVRAPAVRSRRLRRPTHACARVTAASGEVSPPARPAAASAAGMSPAAACARDSARLSLWSSQAGTDHPDRALAMICAAACGASFGQAAVRRYQTGHRPDQLVRSHARGRRPPG